MKKVFLPLIVVLSIGSKSFSQIGNEIRNFVDSTEILVNNGRKLLLKTILEGDNQKAVEVYQYLISSTEGKPLGAFTPDFDTFFDSDLLIHTVSDECDFQGLSKKTRQSFFFVKKIECKNIYINII